MKEYISKQNKDYKISKLEKFIYIFILLISWQIIALKIDNDIYLPTVTKTLSSIVEIISQRRFYIDISYSFNRALLSFITALIVAMIIGILSFNNKCIHNLLSPIDKLLQSIPTMILILLILIWFDKDNTPFIIGFLATVPILYSSVLGAISNIESSLFDMVKIYKVSLIDKIKNIYLPKIKFNLVHIIISTFSLSLKVVIAGEIFSQPKYGIGSIIQIEKTNFNTTAIFAWIIIIFFISTILDKIQNIMIRRTFIWKVI